MLAAVFFVLLLHLRQTFLFRKRDTWLFGVNFIVLFFLFGEFVLFYLVTYIYASLSEK